MVYIKSPLPKIWNFINFLNIPVIKGISGILGTSENYICPISIFGVGGLKRLKYTNPLSSIIYNFWFQGIDKIIRIPPTRGL